MTIIDMETAKAALRSAIAAKDEEVHLRTIANEAMTLMPLDYADTLKVLAHMRFLAQWRHGVPPHAGNGDADGL